MAQLIDATQKLLTLGASDGVIGSAQIFDIGGAGIVLNTQPFDIEAPYVGVFNNQPFDILGYLRVTNSQPFDLGSVSRATNVQPFDIIAAQPQPEPGVPLPPPVIANQTSTTVAITAGQVLVPVNSTTGISGGTVVYIGSNSYLVTNVAGGVLTLATPLLTSQPSGTAVLVPQVTTTLSAPASAGATSVTLTSAANFAVGTVITFRNVSGDIESRIITGISGSTISFTVPLGSSYPSGSGVAQVQAFLTGISIFDKAGAFLGSITDYVINQPRTYSIREPGNMSFYVPRNSPDVNLIASDRLIAVTNSVGLPLWVGTITTQTWGGGVVTVNCEDAFALLVGVPIEMDIFIEDDTLASGLYQQVINLVNARRGLDGEIQWGLDSTATLFFPGDYSSVGDPLDHIEEISNRSGTEYAWRGEIVGTQLQIWLVVRDMFTAAAGIDLTDGPGGNVAASPDYQIDPTTIINGLRITGQTTSVVDYTDDWAEWAVHEIEPFVEVYADTGDYRRRIDLDINVDWSLSKRQQMALGQRTEDDVWALYERYLYGMHDIQGRPNIEGYVYEGPPENIEPGLTADRWKTHLELAKFREGRPCSIVMKSDVLDQWLVVDFLTTSSTKRTTVYGFNHIYTIKTMDADLDPGQYTIWDESGGRARINTVYTADGSEVWRVATSSINARTADGTRISLRGIITASPFQGRYLDLREPGIHLSDTGGVLSVDAEGSQVGKIWPAERPQVRNWDPRRDGTGARLTKTTIYSGAPTTRARWHIVPYSVGDEAETQMAEGIYTVDTIQDGQLWQADKLFVESSDGFPLDDLPFEILVGDPLYKQEMMRVTAAFGNEWTVQRGITSSPVPTTADVDPGDTIIPVADVSRFLSGQIVMLGTESITIDSISGSNLITSAGLSSFHAAGTLVATSGLVQAFPAGTPVRLVGGSKFDGFVYPYTWPEGVIYATNLLNRLRYPSQLVSLNITNENDDWSTVSLGSLHDVSVLTEGPPGGITGTVRVVGMSPDEDAGIMELVVEVP